MGWGTLAEARSILVVRPAWRAVSWPVWYSHWIVSR